MIDEELIKIAFETCHPLILDEDFSSGEVGCALIAENEKIYTGVCIDLACGLGFCAEASAIAEMLKDGETRIKKVVAVSNNKRILPPCGRCREMMIQINRQNLETVVLVSGNERRLLKDLLPSHWLHGT